MVGPPHFGEYGPCEYMIRNKSASIVYYVVGHNDPSDQKKIEVQRLERVILRGILTPILMVLPP